MGDIIVVGSMNEQQRVGECLKEILKVLQKYNCMIIPRVVITDHIENGYQVVPLPELPNPMQHKKG